MPRIQRALLSVSNKKGIVEFAQFLESIGIEILSTGRTAQILQEKGLNIREVSNYTGQPEILDGRVKTLHPKIHGGILAVRSDKGHLQEIKELGISLIDLVVVNLYPFEETIQKKNVTLQEAIENIDIGGPAMLRAAAKNWQDVAVICDPDDYADLIEELKQRKGEISKETSFRLSKKVFALTSRYDGAVAAYFSGGREEEFPEVFSLQAEKIQDLRYGENPHQKAAFYKAVGATGRSPLQEASVTSSKQLHGKELSFNNILDLDATIELVKEFEAPACVIVKHTNPCGVAVGTIANRDRDRGTCRQLFVEARSCDPLSAFGGIIGFNREVDLETAEEIGKDFYECVVAPGFSEEALEILKAKKNIRLMQIPPYPPLSKGGWDFKRVAGGLLVQDRDRIVEDIRGSKVVTKRPPTEEEWDAMVFAWKVARHVKSNAIVLAGPPSEGQGEENGMLRTLGVGAGQMSRVDSVRLAISKMDTLSPRRERVLASDAFFPFRDNVDEAAKAGVTAIIQPGGSLRDQESIDAANEHKIAMVFTGIRHFKH
ncbi:MAG: bifunctional phosphoribosylaminoimidazolecarboxamide formyltransferase/IMP cyclohydrolase [Deltaproteobacteria bacterium]|nr:bifunctional phosphoribosylaminoimidazolecarboxamide formyltransferase/IMP cyclohydrolase [Deltaproteobacteria bacterium]